MIKRMLLVAVMCAAFILGGYGCMEIDRSTVNEAEPSDMLVYLQEKYNQPFSVVEFIPAPRGFNDFLNENILIARSEEGFFVNVRSLVKDPYVFFDNYASAYASWLVDNTLDYSAVGGLSSAKTHVSIYEELNEAEILQLQDSGLKYLVEYDIGASCLLAIKTPLSESSVSGIYEVYKQICAIKSVNTRLQVAFSVADDLAEKYVMNFPYYGKTNWQEFDPGISNYAFISDEGLSFEEFSDQILNWEDTR